MDKRERVIYDIERCICHVPDACRDCSKDKEACGITFACMEELLKDAMELLKEQDAIEPKKVNRYMDSDEKGNPFIVETYDCGNCGKELLLNAKYCHECGKAVKWDD